MKDLEDLLKIKEQGMFHSERDITRLNFIDFKRTNGYWYNDIMGGIRSAAFLLKGSTAYTVAEIDLRAFPERDDWPGWGHIGNHDPLGKLYWNFFHWNFAGKSPKLTFSDMPDFTGSYIDKEQVKRMIHGDIGQVSVSTFCIEVFSRIRANDLWVSVLDEHRQIILEPLIDIGAAYQDHLAKKFGID